MSTWNRTFAVAMLIARTAGLLSAQSANDYRTAASGVWSTTSTWERYSGTQWEAATTSPDSGAGQITVLAGHSVSITSALAVDSLQILGNGSVTIAAGVTVSVPINNGLNGIDVDTLGTLTVNGTIVCQGRVSGSIGAIVFANGSMYDHARNGGDAPRAVWQTGSTMKLTGVTGNSPSNMNQDFYNLVIDCAGLTANLNLGMSGNTIQGDITVLRTGASNRYYLTSPAAFVYPITVMGNIYVRGGVFSTNGSSSAGHIIVHTYGNIIVTAGNFGCSRGSGTSVSWFLYGDTMSISNATLHNSTGSPDRVQKFIFSKQGTTQLRFSNVTYGTGGTSPITLQVSKGTTLDIDTSHLASNSTGSFILDSGAVLVSAHNGPGNEGNIEYLADLGGGNSFVNINATTGTGKTTVKAFKGPHPNMYDPLKGLQRYWTVTADAGITEATMTFYYYDLDPVGTEVRGTETVYKALRYGGVGSGWSTVTGSVVDDFFDFVTATAITSVAADWTVGEAASVGVASPNGPAIPDVFSVDQNYPNPFNPSTSIRYHIPEATLVTIRLFDVLGREVGLLLNEEHEAGSYTTQWNAAGFSSGMYYCSVMAGDDVKIIKLVLLK
ncbi:MAG: hypothetical protein A3G43_01975 [Ignavibacteria bacterium RIFCSPLOWO2_12_FULL_56_21]|nr:MAG: hypothetical protein A3G43_01975 [Ignavibacteria bacterium RIFCSPLOWO2_12_FULL_56_21]